METLICDHCGDGMERGTQAWSRVHRELGPLHICMTCVESSCRYWIRLGEAIRADLEKALGVWRKGPC